MNAKAIGQVGIPVAVVAVVVMMVVPLPTVVLDLLLAVNLAGSVLILLVSMHVRRPLDFTVFPSLLLVATMFRLALNVSAARLVLLHGFAGKVIQSFGHFVVGGSIVVGLVIFLILVVIQFLVVTNGAGRVAEVSARFTLDAMPGKQMAIDADLNAGLIDEEQARTRRREVSAEADFYGAMDGASKFVKGDAIAAIVITAVNLFGGFIVGVVQRHMSLSDAISTFSLLSVGDGLVSQIPALLISVATGLVVTRAATDADMGTDLMAQFGRQRSAVTMAGASIAGLALVPGLPKTPFLAVGGVLFLVGRRLPDPVQTDDAAARAAAEPALSPDAPERLAEEMRVDPLELELAYDLVDLADASQGGDLLDRVRALRRKIALDLGIVIPLVRTRDSGALPPHCYSIRVNGVELARGEAPPNCVLAIGDDLGMLPGTPTREPVFGLAAKWVPVEARGQAELAGATVVDRSSVVTTHLAEVVRSNAARILARQDVKMLIDVVKSSDPVVVDEVTAAGLTLGDVQRVLQGLLDEQVPVRDLVRILEALSARAPMAKDTESLVEAVRAALGPAIASVHATDGRLPLISLDPLLEQSLLEALRTGEGGTFLAVDAVRADELVTAVARRAEEAEQLGESPVLVCSAVLRPALRRLVGTAAPRLPVLSYAELGGQLRLETMGVVTLAAAATV